MAKASPKSLARRYRSEMLLALALASFPGATATAPEAALAAHSHSALGTNIKFSEASESSRGAVTMSSPPKREPAADILLITSANNGQTFQNLTISSKTGSCVRIFGASNITLQNVEIGPCAGRGIDISNSDDVGIYDSYIHTETLSPGCCDNNDGIYAHNGSKNIVVAGNVIAYGESNIEGLGVSGMKVTGNFLLNPRGPKPRGQNFQCYNGCRDVIVNNNYALSSTDTAKYLYAENQEDSINFGMSDRIVAENNFVTGGHSRSGCGIIADDRANNIQFVGNRVLNTGQCGISIADGTNQVVIDNNIYNTNPISGGGNTALQVWKQYKPPCGPVTISRNVADALKPDGTHSGYWNGGGCEPVTLTKNIFDAPAAAILGRTSGTLTPPAIPPQPKNCVANSPYTNNNSQARCGESR